MARVPSERKPQVGSRIALVPLSGGCKSSLGAFDVPTHLETVRQDAGQFASTGEKVACVQSERTPQDLSHTAHYHCAAVKNLDTVRQDVADRQERAKKALQRAVAAVNGDAMIVAIQDAQAAGVDEAYLLALTGQFTRAASDMMPT